jgi:dipeptidyl aminopeptidase/acylaminoacyl peptidase
MAPVSRSFVVFGVVALGAAALQAQTPAKRAVELPDYYRLESASAPAISPDGRKVAFVRSYVVEDENRRHSEIWLAPTDGSAPPVRLTNPAVSSTSPRFSPDGTLLSFSSRRKLPGSDKDASIWFLHMDEPGEAFQIPGVEGTPRWSPDAQWIAFTKETPPGPKPKPQYASDFERKLHERFKGRAFDWMQYRFDGRGYLPDPRDPIATPPEELYVVPRAGGAARRLTSLGIDALGAEWRPDGKALVVFADPSQRDEDTYERSDIWIVPLEGEVRRLTDDGFDHEAPTFSPDGRSVAFTRQQSLTSVIAQKQSHGGPTDLFVMPADGGEPRNLTKDWDLLPGSPTFSPDGRHIYFTAGVGGAAHLFRVPATGGTVEQVTSGNRRIGSVSFSKAGDRIAYLAGDPDRPSEVFAAALTSKGLSGERRVSRVHDALFDQLVLGRTEAIRYKSKDGTEIEGWLLLPHGYDASRRHPLILNIHGGPHGAYGWDFSFPFQLLAANGYVVLYTNPRGSTGYGEKFLWGTWGGWGNLDSEDVLAGVEHAVSRYAVDAKRLGVAGYSYGGFLTNWLVATTSNRFAAAVSGAGISNWISDYATSDIPRTKESEFFGPPWRPEGRERLLSQSPVVRAANATTPTLFIHGEADYRVPIEQAEQMYLALRKLKVPARFVRYPETAHGGWTPWNTVHRYHQELKWWEQYLRGAPVPAAAGH